MITLGIVACDNSHVLQYTMRCNHVEIDEENWVDGARLVCAYPGTSLVSDQSTVVQRDTKLAGSGR